MIEQNNNFSLNIQRQSIKHYEMFQLRLNLPTLIIMYRQILITISLFLNASKYAKNYQQECIPAVAVSRGRGCLLLGGAGCLVCGGWYPSMHSVRHPLPCGQTHACETISFATSLRTVIDAYVKTSVRIL